jgi:hypothetical protein
MPHKVDNPGDERNRERVPYKPKDWTMTHPHKDTQAHRHLQDALEDARRLSEPGLGQTFTPHWSAKAAQVGDLSVLLLALRS